jgi:hypothetical protein
MDRADPAARDDPAGEPAPLDDARLAVMPRNALAVRKPACLILTFDTSRLTCLVCGLRIYVEVRIS